MIQSLTISLLFFSAFIFGNFSNLGPYEIEINNGYFSTSNGDSTEYRLFSPVGAPSAPHIIFAHEFVSSHDYLLDLSQHYASWGIKVGTMNQLHSSLVNNNPVQDAQDLILLSNQILGGGQVIYTGYSAGGLRAIIASALDTNTISFFGLDIVDLDAIGQTYAQDLNIPIFGLAGEASTCNSQLNGIGIYNQAENSKLLRVTEADHCDFQGPNSFFCTFLCENQNNLFSPEQINLLIKNLSTAFLSWQTSINIDGEAWWANGSAAYDSLIITNSIVELVTMSINNNSISPDNFNLYQNYPNPFNPSTIIGYYLSRDSYVNIDIFDLRGLKVKSLIGGFLSAGSHSVQWDATNDFGEIVSTGMYFYTLRTKQFSETNKMLFLN